MNFQSLRQACSAFFADAFSLYRGTGQPTKPSNYQTLIADLSSHPGQTLQQGLDTFIKRKILGTLFHFGYLCKFLLVISGHMSLKDWQQEVPEDKLAELEIFTAQKIHLIIYEPGWMLSLSLAAHLLVAIPLLTFWVYFGTVNSPGYDFFADGNTGWDALIWFSLINWLATVWMPLDLWFISSRLPYYKPIALWKISLLNLAKVCLYWHLFFNANLFVSSFLGLMFSMWNLFSMAMTWGKGPREAKDDVYLPSKHGIGGQVTAHAALAYSLKMLPLGESGIQLGLALKSFQELTKHAIILGKTGAGKTSVLRVFLRDIIANIYTGSHKRALLYDYQNACHSILRMADLQCPIFIINPYDRHKGSAWDFARDCRRKGLIRKFAQTTIPVSEHTKDRFFSEAAQDILIDLITILKVNTDYNFDLRDLILISRYPKLMLGMMLYYECEQRSTAEKGEIVALTSLEKLRGESVTNSRDSVILTLQTSLNTWEGFAAVSHEMFKRNRLVSLVDWVQSESVLILGNSFESEEYIIPVHSYLLDLLFSLLMERADGAVAADDQTFCILDEAPSLKNSYNTLIRMLTQGRQKGISVTMTSLDTSQTTSLFRTKEGYRSAVNQMENKVILKCASPDEAQAASGLVGSYLGINDQEVAIASPIDILSIPAPNSRKRKAGIQGYYVADEHTYQYNFTMRKLTGLTRLFSGSGQSGRPSKILAPYERVPDSFEDLKDFMPEDIQRLKLEGILKFMVNRKIIKLNELPELLQPYVHDYAPWEEEEYVAGDLDGSDDGSLAVLAGSTDPQGITLPQTHDHPTVSQQTRFDRNLERIKNYGLEFAEAFDDSLGELQGLLGKLGLA